MREIKFRAWSNENGCFCGAFSIHMSGAISACINAKIDESSGLPYADAHWGENDLVLMQYTGLKDRNGNEIYEGDIVQWVWLHHPVKAAVEYLSSHGKFCASDREGRLLSTVEVIGNIYENPELLQP